MDTSPLGLSWSLSLYLQEDAEPRVFTWCHFILSPTSSLSNLCKIVWTLFHLCSFSFHIKCSIILKLHVRPFEKIPNPL